MTEIKINKIIIIKIFLILKIKNVFLFLRIYKCSENMSKFIVGNYNFINIFMIYQQILGVQIQKLYLKFFVHTNKVFKYQFYLLSTHYIPHTHNFKNFQ